MAIRNHKAGRSGFTLVELLVVVAIIALLISILLPSLHRARLHAQRVQCMSNLRQLGAIQLMYSNDFRGVLPGWRAQWPTLVYRYFGSRLTSHVQAARMANCPTCPHLANNGWTVALSVKTNWYIKLSPLKDSSKVLLAGDTIGGAYMNPEFLQPPNEPLIWFGHLGTATMLMADMHAEFRRRDEVPVFKDRQSYRDPGYDTFWDSYINYPNPNPP